MNGKVLLIGGICLAALWVYQYVIVNPGGLSSGMWVLGFCVLCILAAGVFRMRGEKREESEPKRLEEHKPDDPADPPQD